MKRYAQGPMQGDLFRLVVGLVNDKFQAGIMLDAAQLIVNGQASSFSDPLPC